MRGPAWEQQSSVSAIEPQSWPMAMQHARCALVISSPMAHCANGLTAKTTASSHPIGRVGVAIRKRIAPTIIARARLAVNCDSDCCRSDIPHSIQVFREQYSIDRERGGGPFCGSDYRQLRRAGRVSGHIQPRNVCRFVFACSYSAVAREVTTQLGW